MANKITQKKKTTKVGEGESKRSKFKFPNISRFIPERINEDVLFLAGLLFILLSSLAVGFDLYKSLTLERRLIGETSELQRKLNFWESEISKHPNFRDAYFNLALIKYQLKDFNSSKNNLEKALEIDPNFKAGIRLKEILSGSY